MPIKQRLTAAGGDLIAEYQLPEMKFTIASKTPRKGFSPGFTLILGKCFILEGDNHNQMMRAAWNAGGKDYSAECMMRILEEEL